MKPGPDTLSSKTEPEAVIAMCERYARAILHPRHVADTSGEMSLLWWQSARNGRSVTLWHVFCKAVRNMTRRMRLPTEDEVRAMPRPTRDLDDLQDVALKDYANAWLATLNERDKALALCLMAGATMVEMGRKLGVSKQRIYQRNTALRLSLQRFQEAQG